jgi:hypothetical protein
MTALSPARLFAGAEAGGAEVVEDAEVELSPPAALYLALSLSNFSFPAAEVAEETPDLAPPEDGGFFFATTFA